MTDKAKAKRIRFTRDELEAINDMCAIASASAWGEGDYMDWDEKRGKHFQSLRRKVWELISRADSLPNNMEAGNEILVAEIKNRRRGNGSRA